MRSQYGDDVAGFCGTCQHEGREEKMKWRAGKGKGKFMRQYENQGGKCAECGQFFPSRYLTRHHVVPRSKGGATDWESGNIILVCDICHRRIYA
jgi:5-methylcytosine-specific restriction endonuclease McrA